MFNALTRLFGGSRGDGDAAEPETPETPTGSEEGGDPAAFPEPDPQSEEGARGEEANRGGIDGDGTDDETPDGRPTVEDLEYRIDELEAELETAMQSVSRTERAQEDIEGTVEEVEDTVRRLLGVYDRLIREANPFADATDGGEGFGVVGSAGSGGSAERAPDGDGSDGRAGGDPDPDDAAEEGKERNERRDGPPDDEVVTVEDVKRLASGDGEEGDLPVPAGGTGGAAGDGVLLTALAETYATDVLVFEWLSMLVETAGPAGAVKALGYYETVGWISEGVRSHLERAVSGPGIDIDVDPNRPRDVTASDHARSYGYVMKLRVVADVGTADAGTAGG